MGRQLNFFMTHSDLMAVEARLKETTPLVILHSRSDRAAPQAVESMLSQSVDPPWLYFYLVHPSAIGDISVRHVANQGYWTIDSLRSPVIEFNCCYSDAQIIRRGRIFYDENFYDDKGVLIAKPEEFCKWAKGIFTQVKKMVKKHEGDYIGLNASECLAANGKMKLVKF